MVGANSHHLNYNLLTAIVFSLHILLEDMLNTKCLLNLTEYQKVAEDWSKKKTAITKIIKD